MEAVLRKGHTIISIQDKVELIHDYYWGKDSSPRNATLPTYGGLIVEVRVLDDRMNISFLGATASIPKDIPSSPKELEKFIGRFDRKEINAIHTLYLALFEPPKGDIASRSNDLIAKITGKVRWLSKMAYLPPHLSKFPGCLDQDGITVSSCIGIIGSNDNFIINSDDGILMSITGGNKYKEIDLNVLSFIDLCYIHTLVTLMSSSEQ